MKNKNILIKPQNPFQQLRYVTETLNKLLEQRCEWGWKRFLYAREGNWEKANAIEQTYIIPLDKKIQSFAAMAQKELL